jgi:hypothetical protein
MPKRPRIGDIVELRTSQGLAYAQYTHKHTAPPVYGELIRVLPHIHPSRPCSFADLVSQKELFFVFFPLGSAVRRNIVTLVGNMEVPDRCREFPLFRTGFRAPDTGRVDKWWLWDGKREWPIGELTPEQRELPVRECINDTLLVERIVSGWLPQQEV